MKRLRIHNSLQDTVCFAHVFLIVNSRRYFVYLLLKVEKIKLAVFYISSSALPVLQQ